LGQLELWSLKALPLAFSPGDSELMHPRDIKQIADSAFRQRIRAEKNHLLAREGPVEFLLIRVEVFPMARSDPEGVPAAPHSSETLGQGHAELFIPATDDVLQVELPAMEVPVSARDQFNLP